MKEEFTTQDLQVEILENYGFIEKEYIGYTACFIIFEHYNTYGLVRDMKMSISVSSNPKLFINDSFIRSVAGMDEVKALYKAITDKELQKVKNPIHKFKPTDQDDLPF